MGKMTQKQKRFCAVRAGYSPKFARGNAHKLVANGCIKDYIASRMAEKDAELIAQQDEVLKYLTSVLRGESEAEVVVVENVGDYMSQARTMKKGPDEKERLKAAELLGKRYGLFTDRVEQSMDMELTISVDYGDGQ